MDSDKVNYSYGMKVNMGNYESADFHISLTTDVKEGETPKQAYERAVKFVEKEAEVKFNELVEIRNSK
jgi:hypothetical protein